MTGRSSVLDGTDAAGCDGAAVAAGGVRTGSISGASDRDAGAAAVGMPARSKDADTRAPIAGMEEEETAAVEGAEVDMGGGNGVPASVDATGAAAAVLEVSGEGTLGLEAAAAAAVSTAACKEAESASAAEVAAAAVLAGNLVRPAGSAGEEVELDLRSTVSSALMPGAALMPGCTLGG